MQSTRRRDTSAEMAIRTRLHRRGYRYRVDYPPLKGLRRRADIVFTRLGLAVFVDGCFWHGCPEHATRPKGNAEWWAEKLERNRQRDRDTDERLRASGWTVLRIWEHEDPDAAVSRVVEAIEKATSSSSR